MDHHVTLLVRHALVSLLLVTASCGDPGSVEVAAPPASSGQQPAPNIILYVVDTLRADSLGCYGNPVVETPTIDRLAAEGTLFEDAVAPSSWTRPSFASLLSGLPPAVHGVHQRRDKLNRSVELLSERLGERGYATAMITTNPNVGRAFGFDQGFDDFIELYSRKKRGVGLVRPRALVTGSPEATERATEWIYATSGPFFLVILTIDPHSPYAPPSEFDRYGGDYAGEVDGEPKWINSPELAAEDKERIRSLYYGEIAFNDDSLGRLLEHLRATGIEDETVVALTADHGEEFWEHGERGHGKTLYEEVVRVPLIVRFPPAGKAASPRPGPPSFPTSRTPRRLRLRPGARRSARGRGRPARRPPTGRRGRPRAAPRAPSPTRRWPPGNAAWPRRRGSSRRRQRAHTRLPGRGRHLPGPEVRKALATRAWRRPPAAERC